MFKETNILMDTVAEISCFDSDHDKARNAVNKAFLEMRRIEKVFNKFDDSSEISKINKLAGDEEIAISPEVLKLTEDALYYSRISKGRFDITIGPLMEVWGFVSKNNSIPDDAAINKTLECVGYKNIILDTEKMTVHFLNKGVKLDFGGIAKGYAVDRARHILLSSGIKNGLINLGGNIFAAGSPPGRKYWRIGIQDPRVKNKLLLTLHLKDRAVSTSGNYERFFISNGKKYSHIINPVTGKSSQGIISVTVVADSAEEADALSTAIFVMGEKEGLELAKSLKNIEVYILKEDNTFIKHQP